MENNKFLREIVQNLWHTANLLRHQLTIDEFSVIFYLLILYRSRNDKSLIINSSANLLEYSQDYFDIEIHNRLVSFFSSSLDKLNDNDILNIFSLFSNLPIDDENFSTIFDELLYTYSKSRGKHAGEFILPREIAEFLCEVADVKENAKVYNPFAGLASFGVFFNERIQYIGQEINTSIWAIGYLRLLAHNKSFSSVYKLEDSVVNFEEHIKCDLIITDPPYYLNNFSDKYRLAESFVLSEGINKLTNDGKLIMLVPTGFLFKSGIDNNIHREIVDNDYLETIIELPSSLMPHTSISVSVMIINKNKTYKDSIKFIDATKSFIILNNKDRILDKNNLLSLVNSYAYPNQIRIIKKEKVREYDYNLNPRRYFETEIEGETLINLITHYKGEKFTGKGNGRLVKLRDLKDNPIDYILTSDMLIDEDLPQRTITKIEESCLLISTQFKTLKPTFFKYQNEPIFLSSGIEALIVDENKIDIEYLIHELNSDYVVDQIKYLNIGTSLPRLSRKDLLRIKIKLSTIEEQKAKVQGIKQAFLRSKRAELEMQQEILGLKDESFREYASLRHTLGQYLNALKSNVAGTARFIANNVNTNINLDTVYSKNLNRTFGEHLSGLEGIIDSMSKLLQNFDQDEAKKEIRQHDVSNLIKESQNRFKDPEKFNFEELFIDKESFTMMEEDGAELLPIIDINEEDFFNIFSNVVSNAKEHGFKDINNDNIIRTTLSFENETNMCVVEISNNGLPFAEGFYFKDLTTRGEKTANSGGSGIGGSDIKEIMRKYGGTFELDNNRLADFPVKYILKFPLLIIYL